VAKFDKVIPPGQEGKVHMVIEGSKVHDNFRKSATIFSNDPEHPTMTITIAGHIIPYVSVTPSSKIFLQGHFDETIQKTITFKSNEEDLDFAIKQVESNLDDKITYDYRRNEEDGMWELDIWKNPKLPTSSTYGSLIVHTNSEKSPTKTIQVQVITKGAITVQPGRVNFGTVRFGKEGEPAQPITRNVTVVKTTGDFEVRDVTFSSNEFFSAEIEPVRDGKQYTIKVTFHPPVKKRPNQTHVGEMIVHTNDPREPELKVRLTARSI